MGSAIRWLVWTCLRFVLSLRYRVRVTGAESLAGLGRKSRVLILPNHPGYSDPALVLSQLGPKLDPRPLVYEGTFDNPFMWPVMKIINALKVPDMEGASAQARQAAEASVQAIIDGLRAGNNHVFWPAGRCQRDGTEVIGGARALTDVLTAVPDCEIVRIRTRGLWGSVFSYAYTGARPALSKRILGAMGTLLANLLFFTPRRDVRMTIERLDKTKLPPLRREKVNAFFEAWYNAEGPETPTFVPYHLLFGPRTHDYPAKPAGPGEVDPSRVKPEVKAEVLAMLSEKLKRPLDEREKEPGTTLDQMGLDSIDRMEFSLQLEDRFGFGAEQSPQTVGQCWALAAGLLEKGPPRPAPAEWSALTPDEEPPAVLGETVAEAFVTRALRNRRDVAVADDLSGVLTYERLLIGSILMSKRFSMIDATNVGLLLPASVAGDVALLGLHLAGKVPVVLNWTTGSANLAHAVESMGLTHVITSQKFVDRLRANKVTLEGVRLLYVEGLRADVSRFETLRTLLAVRRLPALVRAHLSKVDPDSPAVVLFTSGSEKAPKAVPLTHRNLLCDVRAAMAALGLTRHDSILGFLPPFHSFGLTVTTLGPILCGFRVVHHPDPTDAGALAHKVGLYKVTVLAGTPTFFGYVLDRAKGDELHSLRLVFVGAEKCPDSVFERAQKLCPNAAVLEGYGITECSPIVAVNTPGARKPGTVGKALPGVETRLIDAESGRPVDGGIGMLLVSGPTVFPGYLAYEGESPFREIDGRRWYVTGDLVEIDAEGFIRFAGRLKRFIKAGGEMISLPALEEPFAKRYPPTEQGPRVAVEGVELPGGGRRVVLFTTEDVPLRDANAILQEAGFRGVMRLDEVRRVETIPVLGTGKTDYKALRAQVGTSC
jgi:long-chain-fatty-acid--[acyl-carrier-protein] ligase